jgi:hypothetical protein
MLYQITGGGKIMLVRAADRQRADELFRRRAGLAGNKKTMVQEIDHEGDDGVVSLIVPREPAAQGK